MFSPERRWIPVARDTTLVRLAFVSGQLHSLFTISWSIEADYTAWQTFSETFKVCIVDKRSRMI